MQFVKTMTQFCVGGSAYVALELLYRRRSHISMFGAGGLCYVLLGQLGRRRLPPALQAGCGAGIITAVELTTGLLFNREYQVWDYRDQSGNVLGHICPAFTAMWVPLGIAALELYRWMDGELDRLMPSSRPNPS